MLDISHLLSTQREFNQGRFIDYETATPEHRMRLSKDLILHLLHEAHEVLDHLDWKMHKKPGGEIDKFATAEELVDVLKFWAAIPTIWDISPELLSEIHRKKSTIVSGRYEVEHMLPPTGPGIHVVWADVMDDLAVGGRGLLAGLVDKYDGVLVVDVPASMDADSELKFELEYLLTGVWMLRWRRASFPNAFDDVIGVRSCAGSGADVVLPLNQPIDGHPGLTHARTFESAVCLVDGYLARIVKEMIN